MEYFNFLNKNDVVGIVAPSMGAGNEPYRKNRVNQASVNFKKRNIKTMFSENCFNNTNARSASAETRAEEFETMFFNKDVKGIISIGGGEFELEVLPYINFNKIKKAPNKFFQGMSDNTCLAFTLTTICDKASIYGYNFSTFGMKKWHNSLTQNFNFLCGENKEQISYNKFETESLRKQEGHELDGFNLTEKLCPQNLTGETNTNFSGRIIGGCLDILSHICGTKFDNVKNFIKKYKEEGIIWYFESCELNVLEQSRCIWKLKQAGWFDGARGFIIGRPLVTEELYDCNYKTCNYENLKDFNVPVVINCDIGHTNPNWYIVNGALATFELKNNKATLNFELKP